MGRGRATSGGEKKGRGFCVCVDLLREMAAFARRPRARLGRRPEVEAEGGEVEQVEQGGELVCRAPSFHFVSLFPAPRTPAHGPPMSAALGYALLAAGPGIALYRTFLGGRSFLLLVTLAR